MNLPDLTWPQAFALVFGGLPAFTLALAVLGVYPAMGWPLVVLGCVGYGLHRRAQTRAALAARADASLATYAALIASPLPAHTPTPATRPRPSEADARTVPLRRVV